MQIVHTDKKDFTLSNLREMIADGDIIPDPDYQRSYVFDDNKASRLIESILIGIPIPTVYLSQEEDDSYTVIDGQQRITSIRRYLDNESAGTGPAERKGDNGKMKNMFLLACVAGIGFAANGASYDVRAFGAKGDGVAKDTAAIQKAVDACNAAGGGTVEVPPGVYLSGTIYLKSHVDFCIGPGATIKGSPDKEDYNAYDVCPQNGRSITENASGAHLFMCIEQKNVTLRGPGTIDGNGAAFMLGPDGRHYALQAIPWRPSQMVYFVECEDVRVRDLRLRNPAYWTLFLHGCTHVFVSGVDIRTGRTWHSAADCYIYQGDGIDVDCCQHVSISDCHLRDSDDGITLRAAGGRLKRPQDTRYVTINNCTVSSSSCAFRFGVGSGKISDVTVSNVVIWDSRVAFDFCTSWGTNGVSYANMLVDNVAVADCRWFLRASYHGIKGTDMRGLRFSNIRAKASENALIWGYPEHPISDVRFVNVDCNMPIELINCEDCEIVGGTLKAAALTEEELADRMKKIASGFHPN